jgi:hypothetical protein
MANIFYEAVLLCEGDYLRADCVVDGAEIGVAGGATADFEAFFGGLD